MSLFLMMFVSSSLMTSRHRNTKLGCGPTAREGHDQLQAESDETMDACGKRERYIHRGHMGRSAYVGQWEAK